MAHRGITVRYAIATLVVGGHLVLIAMFSIDYSQRPKQPIARAQARGELFFVELPAASQGQVTSIQEFQDGVAVKFPEHVDFSPSGDEWVRGPPAQSPVDWHLEAERVARESGAELAREMPECGESRRETAGRAECAEPYPKFRWNPEPRRVGVAGGLPYLRLGERCVVTLGAFGCALGKQPKASGDLFDGMRHPDRPRSSVPDVNE